MKLKFFCSLLMPLLFSVYANAQSTKPLVLKIIDGPEHSNGYWFFSIEKPMGILLHAKQHFLCKGVFRNNSSDTLNKGSGMIDFVDDNFIRCEMKEKDVSQEPVMGDICVFLIKDYFNRQDIFYKLALLGIDLADVNDSTLFDAKNNLLTWSEETEMQLVKVLQTDIIYTGTAMKEQQDSQAQLIEGGIFDGQNLFDAMQVVTTENVISFIKYIWARPQKYMGQRWKIDEIFATWMVNGTPEVIE